MKASSHALSLNNLRRDREQRRIVRPNSISSAILQSEVSSPVVLRFKGGMLRSVAQEREGRWSILLTFRNYKQREPAPERGHLEPSILPCRIKSSSQCSFQPKPTRTEAVSAAKARMTRRGSLQKQREALKG